MAADLDHGLLIRIGADAFATLMKRPMAATNGTASSELRERFLAGRDMCHARKAATTPQPDKPAADGMPDHSHDAPGVLTVDGTDAGLQAALAELPPGLDVITRPPNAIDTPDEALSAIYAVSTMFARRVWEQVRPLVADEWRVLDAFYHRGLQLTAPQEPATPPENGDDPGETDLGESRPPC